MRMLAACAAMVALCPYVLREGRAEASPESKDADDWLHLGLTRYEAGDFKGAIDAFLAGHAIDPRPAFLFAIAQAERRRGDCATAVVYYERFLATSPPEEQAAAARDQRDRCEHAVGAAPVSAPLPAPVTVPEPEPEPVPEPEPPPFTPPPAPRRHSPLVLGLGGGAGALTVVGTVLLVNAAGAARDAAAAETYDDHAALRARAESQHTYGVVTLSAGLALGAAAALFYWRPWADDTAVTVSPEGVAVAGRW